MVYNTTQAIFLLKHRQTLGLAGDHILKTRPDIEMSNALRVNEGNGEEVFISPSGLEASAENENFCAFFTQETAFGK